MHCVLEPCPTSLAAERWFKCALVLSCLTSLSLLWEMEMWVEKKLEIPALGPSRRMASLQGKCHAWL